MRQCSRPGHPPARFSAAIRCPSYCGSPSEKKDRDSGPKAPPRSHPSPPPSAEWSPGCRDPAARPAADSCPPASSAARPSASPPPQKCPAGARSRRYTPPAHWGWKSTAAPFPPAFRPPGSGRRHRLPAASAAGCRSQPHPAPAGRPPAQSTRSPPAASGCRTVFGIPLSARSRARSAVPSFSSFWRCSFFFIP